MIDTDGNFFIGIIEALESLTPRAEYIVTNGVIVNWVDAVQTQPSDSAITTEITRLQNEYGGNAYQRIRADAYAELKEQFDLLYHDMTAGKGDATGEWYKAVKAVKDATPKP